MRYWHCFVPMVEKGLEPVSQLNAWIWWETPKNLHYENRLRKLPQTTLQRSSCALVSYRPNAEGRHRHKNFPNHSISLGLDLHFTSLILEWWTENQPEGLNGGKNIKKIKSHTGRGEHNGVKREIERES